MSRAFGSVRQSQVVTTYGPGALIDLPAHSAIVGGLDTWPQGLQEIVELRLSRALQQYTDVPAPKLFAPPPATLDPWLRDVASHAPDGSLGGQGGGAIWSRAMLPLVAGP